ncbi:LuxR C-terminal-related transcriptional regulator [Gordonia insulae]|uniref:HTH luxR-type domain-containing protein n=1 Tax=Gordonia insulae TaxID=2420509 RepID=A0A3G8JTJ1_9ACTN|nr:hypothetical protein D7316_04648 [Gordonia insulae]
MSAPTAPQPTLTLPTTPALSRREVEVLRTWLICDSKQEVAQALFVSSNTVNAHLARIRSKYEAVGRPAPTKISLLIRAVEDGHCTFGQVARAVTGRVAQSAA